MCSRAILVSLCFLGIATFFYEVQAAPTAVALRDSNEVDHVGSRVKRQGGGCGCCGCGCGCGCCGCGGGGGGGCGCCCCRPRCCCQRCCTCCRTCCCTRCCTCCRPCCCGCGCGCCGCGGGRKRRALQNLRIKLAEKVYRSVDKSTEVPEVNAEEPQATLEQPIILPVHVRPEEESDK